MEEGNDLEESQRGTSEIFMFLFSLKGAVTGHVCCENLPNYILNVYFYVYILYFNKRLEKKTQSNVTITTV